MFTKHDLVILYMSIRNSKNDVILKSLELLEYVEIKNFSPGN